MTDTTAILAIGITIAVCIAIIFAQDKYYRRRIGRVYDKLAAAERERTALQAALQRAWEREGNIPRSVTVTMGGVECVCTRACLSGDPGEWLKCPLFEDDDWEAEMDGWEQLSDEALHVALELADDATEDDMIRAISPGLIADAMAAQPSADWRAELDALDADSEAINADALLRGAGG